MRADTPRPDAVPGLPARPFCSPPQAPTRDGPIPIYNCLVLCCGVSAHAPAAVQVSSQRRAAWPVEAAQLRQGGSTAAGQELRQGGSRGAASAQEGKVHLTRAGVCEHRASRLAACSCRRQCGSPARLSHPQRGLQPPAARRGACSRRTTQRWPHRVGPVWDRCCLVWDRSASASCPSP